MMFHIGFDPFIETGQEHKALIRQNELLRLAEECTQKTQAGLWRLYRIIGLLGRRLSSLGINLESRFGATREDQKFMGTGSSTGSCSS